MKAALIKAFAFLLIINYSKAGKAQKIETDKKLHVAIHLNTLGLIDPHYPTIQPGIEGRYKSFAISYKYGPAINTLKKKPKSGLGELLSYEGNKQKIEGRWYYDKGEQFVGIEAFISNFKKERQHGKFYDRERENEYNYDYVRQKIDVWGVAIKFGIIQQLNKHFFLEYTNSIGMRSHTLVHKETRNVQASQLLFKHKEWKFSYPDTEGARKTPHLAIELIIGYKLF